MPDLDEIERIREWMMADAERIRKWSALLCHRAAIHRIAEWGQDGSEEDQELIASVFLAVLEELEALELNEPP